MIPDYSARKRGKPTLPIRERLYSHIDINPITECWEWNGSKRGGYGRIIVGSRKDGSRRTITAHRLSYILNFGEIPDGMEICHKCDNPCCINPGHLFAGTRQDNVNDREIKGRNITFTGEEQPLAKLTKKAVKDARWERTYKGTSYEKLAAKYGVAKKTIHGVTTGPFYAASSGRLPGFPQRRISLHSGIWGRMGRNENRMARDVAAGCERR